MYVCVRVPVHCPWACPGVALNPCRCPWASFFSFGKQSPSSQTASPQGGQPIIQRLPTSPGHWSTGWPAEVSSGVRRRNANGNRTRGGITAGNRPISVPGGPSCGYSRAQGLGFPRALLNCSRAQPCALFDSSRAHPGHCLSAPEGAGGHLGPWPTPRRPPPPPPLTKEILQPCDQKFFFGRKAPEVLGPSDDGVYW